MDASTRLNAPALRPLAPADRRRPGRFSADPTLVPLLRRAAGVDGLAGEPSIDEAESVESGAEQDEGGRFVRGVGFAVLLAAPFWLVVALVGTTLLR